MSPWSGAELPPPGRQPGPYRALFAIAGVFLLLGFLTREHYGSTWDEAESYEAGRRNLEIAGEVLSADAATIAWPWHELPGHQLVLDTTRAAFAAVVTPWLPPSPAPVGERIFNLSLTTASLVLCGAIAFEITGGAVLAALAAGALALQPKLIAHAQNNPKDLPGLLVFTLGVLALARLTRRPGARSAALAAVALGVALTTWLPAIVLAPIAAGILLLTPSSHRRHRRLGWLGAVLLGAAVVGFATWPWLWPDPLGRLRQIADRLAEFPTGFEVLYFGQLHPSNALPAHYTAGSLLVATPVVLVLLAGLGASVAVRPTRGDEGRRRLALLALAWIAGLLALDAAATFHYDGARHVLAVLPALALLVALGVERAHLLLTRLLETLLDRRVGSRGARAIAALALVFPAVALVVDLTRLHPYQDAYLSLPFRRQQPGANETRFEIEYWGGAYRELARWLDREAEPGATIVAPIAPHCLEPYLRPDLVVRERLRRRAATERPPYVVFLTRQAWYRPLGLDQIVESGPPLHSVRTATGTLAVVYRPARLPDALTRPGGPRSWKPPRGTSSTPRVRR